ncbi:glycosyltransferase [Limnovirga soli]|uniref:Glycosyltransferase n=1 Tax=Limnovirga soli TaxID=2656915 RepID=A0A8J8FME3_9BACT|nr:glycosyltransferase [Limnovirga soli]NNV57549.1 glycosyltransferase [Limnovirga soli]
MMQRVLWLASWYPNKYEPVNGDFIQRHAIAVAAHLPVDVVHVLQLGANTFIAKDNCVINKKGMLTEYIYEFAFTPRGISVVDKIRYQLAYKKCYRKAWQQYKQQFGKPAFVHVHVPMKAGFMALELLKKENIPYVVSEQASHYEMAAPDNFFTRSYFYRSNTKRVFANAALVTNVSATIGKKLASLFNLKEVITIHNLVDTAVFNYSGEDLHTPFRFLHVSSMSSQKNVTGILDALALLKRTAADWECVFCGPAGTDLIDNAAAKGLQDKVHFTGEITYTQVAEQMKQSDAFILFSDHENFPCVVVEALCCGLPVISSTAGGVAEAVHNKNGYLVAAGDSEDLYKKLLHIIDHYEVFNRALIANEAAALYNCDQIANEFLLVYQRLQPAKKVFEESAS